MNRLRFLSLLPLFFFLLFHVEAQSDILHDDAPSPDAVSSFKPSLAVVIGILCVMFALTFILLLYAKFCHNGSSSVFSNQQNRPALIRSASRFSGIDKSVIESLPFFRFSSLRGSKQGLECAVCLSKFEDIEILRLLPKCKHAFHINCIDQWLEKHSSCPLCRLKVNAEDPTIFTYSNSMRLLFNNYELREDSNIELFVQREEEHRGSSRFSIGGSFRKSTKEPNKEEEVLIKEEAVDKEEPIDQKILHKYNHKIIVSDVIFKNRWSTASSSDLMFLNSELLNDMSSNTFSTANDGQFSTTRAIENDQVMKIKEEMEMKRLFESKVSTTSKTGSGNLPPDFPSSSDSSKTISSHISRTADPTGRRSMSEITSFSRFQDSSINNRVREPFDGNERTRRLWLPIARRTVQWFADRERRSKLQSQNQSTTAQLSLDV